MGKIFLGNMFQHFKEIWEHYFLGNWKQGPLWENLSDL